ncbi:MAG: DeoR/GlpR transcriptional regulator [Bacteroidetes bacterium]|nr:DeoR/GlpR transcriptional regulator [Bacteroidota bacterium]
MLFTEERRTKLIELINEKKSIAVAELCDFFSVSTTTVRNDLRELNEMGHITRTHGGAMRRTKPGYEMKLDNRVINNLSGKTVIARLALSQINDGDTIILDHGTTVRELAKILGNKKNLSVVTNDLTIAGIVGKIESCEVLVIGGLLRKGFHCTLGKGLLTFLGALSVDKAFMGTSSFSANKGASTPDMIHAEIQRELIKTASEVIVLCDHTKLECESLMNFASPDSIDLLITDVMNDELKKAYQDMNIIVLSGN